MNGRASSSSDAEPMVVIQSANGVIRDGCSSIQTQSNGKKNHRSCFNIIWRKRTRCERALILTLLIMALCYLILIVAAIFWPNMMKSLQAKETVCTSIECVEAAANLLNSIDQSVDPCDDFYEYACAGWNRNHPIPDDSAHFGTFDEVRNRVMQEMKELLESRNALDVLPIKNTKLLYDKCMDNNAIKALKGQHLIKMLHKLGPFPMLQDPQWQAQETWTMKQTVENLVLHVGQLPFAIYQIHADARDTTRAIINIDQQEPLLGRNTRNLYLNDTAFGKHMATWKQYIREMVTLVAEDASVTLNRTQLDADVETMVQFEKKFAELMTTDEMRRDPNQMYNLWTLEELTLANSAVEWESLFRQESPPSMKTYWNKSTPVNVADPHYIDRLNQLLKSSEKNVLINYGVFRAIHTLAKLLDERYDDARFNFTRTLFNQKKRVARWKECTSRVTNSLLYSAGALYVKHHFDSRDKAAATEMIKHITDSFRDIVNELSWMDEETKTMAIKKADSIRPHLGYPDFILNATALSDFYNDLHLSPEMAYFEMMETLMHWGRFKEYEFLVKPFNKDWFDSSPAEVNAYYSPEKNAITFPAGILQPPFFNRGYPHSINFGAIGAVIGHEITHGFDDQGCNYDADGNLMNWWKSAARRGFFDRKKCMIEQYSNYRLPGIGLNVSGKATQGENIADNGGVKEAYNAYQKYKFELGHEEPRLPGMKNFTHEQLFFLSYAHFWCGAKKPNYAVQQIISDEHAPEQFRVIGVLSNLNSFAAAFRCSVGTRMNPAKSNSTKCDVW